MELAEVNFIDVYKRQDEHSGSVPLAFETVFDKGQNADFWLIKYNQDVYKRQVIPLMAM